MKYFDYDHEHCHGIWVLILVVIRGVSFDWSKSIKDGKSKTKTHIAFQLVVVPVHVLGALTLANDGSRVSVEPVDGRSEPELTIGFVVGALKIGCVEIYLRGALKN